MLIFDWKKKLNSIEFTHGVLCKYTICRSNCKCKRPEKCSPIKNVLKPENKSIEIVNFYKIAFRLRKVWEVAKSNKKIHTDQRHEFVA